MYIFSIILAFQNLFGFNLPLDLEEKPSDFVLETKQIHIPGYPHAFNPSIIRWQGKNLLSFRVIPNRKSSFNSEIGLVFLDDDFNAISDPQILKTNVLNPNVPSRAEDARLISVGERLYIVYANNKDEKITAGGFRVYVSQLDYRDDRFYLKHTECLTDFEGVNPKLREKNWVAFDYNHELFLAYSLNPHLIFKPLFKDGLCETFAKSKACIDWDLGLLRGGTPALLIDDKYISFFHSSTKMSSLQSDNKETLHYFMGAYTFSKEPPFTIQSISSFPIIGKNFYEGKKYKPYWHAVQAVFPGGFIYDDYNFFVVYGRQDHEAWVVKLDKKRLLESLKSVD